MLTARRQVLAAAALLAAALATWILTVQRMRGMDAGPGTDLGGLGFFLGVWVTMMAAMMLPSVAPFLLLHARVSKGRSTLIFALGYLAAWTALGLVAYGVYRAIHAANPGFLSWNEDGPVIAGLAIAAAGVYQLTPLKRACLRHCRSPLHFILHDWRDGQVGALRMGAKHGTYCVGCCVGLMLVLFALGVMSVLWMAVVAAVVFAEKVLPFGARLSAPLAVLLVGVGIWLAAAPADIPGLTQP